mmetsp:Transcript_74012/g.209594  ORF Transcript_74012/g.209594 Transcript_74012/m.209594 type:complete len:337 (+) Transcript_74012:2041-3051(+)
MRKPTQMSRVCSMKPGTLAMSLGLASAKEMMTSRASLRVSSGLSDLASARSSGSRCEATACLKNSTDSCVPSIACSTAFTCDCSAPSATRCREAHCSGIRGRRAARSSFFSSLSTSSKNMEQALACTATDPSTKHDLSTTSVCSPLASITCQTDTSSSFTAHSASDLSVASLPVSMMILMSAGMSSGQAAQFCGLSPSAMSISWFPRLWTMSATFLRTLGCASASSSCKAFAMHSCWAGTPSCDQVDPSSPSLLRHCLSSTAACSRTGSSSWPSSSTCTSAATVCCGCCALAPLKHFSAAPRAELSLLCSARSVPRKSAIAMTSEARASQVRTRGC